MRRWTDDLAVVAPTARQGRYWIEQILRTQPEKFLGLNPVLVVSERDAQGRRFARAMRVGSGHVPSSVYRAMIFGFMLHPLRAVEKEVARA